MLDEMKSLQKLENASHKKALEISNLLTFSLKTTQETKKSVNKISSDFCIILFIRNGQASLFIDDNCIKLNRYDLVIISPKTAYHLDTSDKQDIVTILSMPIPFIQQRLLPLIKQNELLHNIFSKISYDFDLHSAYLFFKNTAEIVTTD
ncbi:hypothetical protein [Enterococcus asini]|uniref:hypothetical protein n=1 Tax=Enterococcus asini TaxID=57732 RepID=UPI000E512AF4|nr:hypothetical protein [Enterococcus asini]RGW13384.1 hypothetical protein DWV91_06905 [Enterococcus asini]